MAVVQTLTGTHAMPVSMRACICEQVAFTLSIVASVSPMFSGKASEQRPLAAAWAFQITFHHFNQSADNAEKHPLAAAWTFQITYHHFSQSADNAEKTPTCSCMGF
eukprot:384330-Pelagomonas_calceolata.AAC.2